MRRKKRQCAGPGVGGTSLGVEDRNARGLGAPVPGGRGERSTWGAGGAELQGHGVESASGYYLTLAVWEDLIRGLM